MPNEHRANDHLHLHQIVALTRQLVSEAAKLLSDPVPDTFLGRKTQEPFPPRG